MTMTSLSLWVTFVAWMPAGFGIGLVFTTLSATALSGAGAERAGLVGSQLGIADALGFAVSAGIGGALVGIADRTSLSLAVALRVLFVGCAVAAMVGMTTARRVAAPAASGALTPAA